MKRIRPELVRLTKANRLYHHLLPIVGITGGIATGKSTVSNYIQSKGLKVIDADKLVKNIYSDQETKDFIRKHFPESIEENQINFQKLRELFFSNEEYKKELEAFIYHRLPSKFLEEAEKIKKQNFILYDVPLLFEKNLEETIDYTLLIYASPEKQIERLTKRDHISSEFAQKIMSQQMDINLKKEKAQYVIKNDGDLDKLFSEIEEFLKFLLSN